MMRPLSILSFLTVVIATSPATVAAQDADAIMTRAQNAWSRINTLRATFEQTVMNPLTGSSLTARGELQQKKPDRLSITFTDPVGDRIVADGRYVWLYLPSAATGQVLRIPAADLAAANSDLLGQFLTAPRTKYDVADLGTEKLSGRDNRVLVLTAKPGQPLPFIRAKVWIDAKDALIRQFEATDANGVSRRVRLLTLATNAPVDTSSFAFTVPSGVRIVDR